MVTNNELDKLEALARTATPGPWRECGHDRGGCPCALIWSPDRDELVAEAWHGDDMVPRASVAPAVNAAFIAAANPATVLQLIEQIRALMKVVSQVEVGGQVDAGVGVQTDYAARLLAMAQSITENCAPYHDYDSNGPDYLKCRCCLGVVLNNDRKARPEDIEHDHDCAYIEAVGIVNNPPQANATSGSELAGGSVLDIAARIFDFKPHKQTEEVKAKYLRFANEVISQQAGAHADDDAPYGYVLKTGHGNSFAETLNHVHPDVRHWWKPVYTKLAAPAPAAEEVRWSKESPTEQADYWHWDGNEDHAPMIYHVMWSGTAKKCFVSIGQYGIDEAIWCDNFGGYWMKIEQPSVRAAMSASQGKNGEAK